ncbi:SH3 domain-binding protein 2 isoform X2 [Pangasianodon hypophthalmus]|uniref:SH3 domain-binding protein 2 isoform X2 n=1 Tax=Pangasianodon hypophthalmus TaxID=310915 RepID=UPI002307D8B6|nr:SH3 domain-binding protein 2 isoform X2 [Pangasianodon hypophthalmus]
MSFQSNLGKIRFRDLREFFPSSAASYICFICPPADQPLGTGCHMVGLEQQTLLEICDPQHNQEHSRGLCIPRETCCFLPFLSWLCLVQGQGFEWRVCTNRTGFISCVVCAAPPQYYMDLLLDIASTVSMSSESRSVRGIRRQMSKRNMTAAPISWPVPMRAIGAQNLLTMPGGVAISGYLHKKGGSQFSLMKWPLRYIIIHKGCVYYFKTSTSATPQGAFSLNGYNRVMRATEETTSSNVFPFKIVHFSKRHRTWYFSAASEDERRKWMRYLRKEIGHYNDKKDLLDASESDSDESFYGPIESPLEITNNPDDHEGDYVEQNDESDEDDYLMPDGPAGQPKAPPPSYPPPPVPNHPKGLPPPVPHTSIKAPPYPIQKKSTTPVPSPPKPSDAMNKGPPPAQKPVINRMTVAPGPLPVCQKKPVAGSVSLSTLPGYDRKPAPAMVIKNPSTLHICEDLENKLVLNSRDRSSSHNMKNSPGERKLTSLGYKPPPKCPPPGMKPKPTLPSLQSSPDGQSFRSSVEEKPLKKSVISDNDEDSDDNDYENVQLPDSVFVETTETSTVEKLFKETNASPPDGLYCIRNSGTKTSKVLVVWDVSLNKARNYRLFEEDEIVYLEAGLNFPSMAALVEYYYSHPLPNHGSLCLQQPFGYTPPR